MGGKETKLHKKTFNPELFEESTHRLKHYEKTKPEFVMEKTNITSNKSYGGNNYFFPWPCIQITHQKHDNNKIDESWKGILIQKCSELENRTFWAKNFKILLKKFRSNVSHDYFLEQFANIEPPQKLLSEHKPIDSLENSMNLESINNNYKKASLLKPSSKLKGEKSDRDIKKRIKKILSSTEILDENFHENLIKTELLKPIPHHKNSEEFKKGYKCVEDYKNRKFSFEYSGDSRTKSSFSMGRSSLDINNKENFHFKNNTFVIDYQTFLSSLNNPNEQTNLKKEEKSLFINHYKTVTEKIESHFKILDHPLGYLFQNFFPLFENEYENKMVLSGQQNSHDKYTEIYEEAIINLKDMIRVFQEGVSIYYDLKKYKDQTHSIFLFTKDNLINFITSLTFDNEYIYEYLFTLQKNIDVFREISIRKNLEKTKHFKPCDFGISEKISLNKETINYFKNLNNFDNHDHLDIFSEKNMKEDITSQYYQPYKKAILNLKLIENVRSPLHKLKIVLKCAESIMKSIRRFYEENERVFMDNISGDEILTIFIYIITKANIPFLVSHCNFIEKFITNQLSCSISGYYFSTIMAAIYYIENKK